MLEGVVKTAMGELDLAMVPIRHSNDEKMCWPVQ